MFIYSNKIEDFTPINTLINSKTIQQFIIITEYYFILIIFLNLSDLNSKIFNLFISICFKNVSEEETGIINFKVTEDGSCID